jgi:hypothetical protein
MKFHKRVSFFIFIISIFRIFNVHGSIYNTVASGFWTNSSTWQNGVIPPYTNNDTVVVKHFIQYSDDLVLNNGALLQVDSSGSICGHHNIIANTGSTIITYGNLLTDTMFGPGGHIYFNQPGSIILSAYGTFSSGAIVISNTSLQVGPWFNCISKPAEINEKEVSEISVFPVPVKNILYIAGLPAKSKVYIYDMNNYHIRSFLIDANSDKTAVDVQGLPDGIYILSIEANTIFRKKVLINQAD